jgi:hypothetical protein
VRSNAAGSLSSLIFDKPSFQVYLQFNNTTTAYLQCCRLPMLQAPNNAAGSLCCCTLPTCGDTARGSLCCSLPTRGETTLPAASSRNAAYVTMLQPLALCCSLPGAHLLADLPSTTRRQLPAETCPPFCLVAGFGFGLVWVVYSRHSQRGDGRLYLVAGWLVGC